MFELEMEEVPSVSDHSLWVERYRPKKFEDYIGSEVVKETIGIFLKNSDIPHLMFYGPPGTGKTTLGKLLIAKIPCDSLIINASDENGVDSIRTKVQDFAMTMGVQPRKILFLDEADRLTQDAQGILRNLMETYSATTRFVLTCNYHNMIMPALHSRVQSFEIKPPSKKDVANHLAKILNQEKVTFKPEDVVFIVNSYFPDMRKIINFAQQSTVDGVLKIAKENAVDQDYREKLLALLKTHTKAGVFTEIRQCIADASFSNYEAVYKYLFDHVSEYAAGKEPLVIVTLAEAVYQSSLVFEREITFCAAMHKLLKVLNSK
jgi:DNA polymerase III delta prime subunit